MAVVFVTHEDPRLDYTPAFKFGEKLVAIFPPGGQVTLSPQTALGQARKVLHAMTPEDSLALVGDPIIMGLCVAVAVELLGKVRLLRWNKWSLSYTLVEIDFLDRIPAVAN